MDTKAMFLQILLVTIPIIVVLITVYNVINKFLKNDENRRSYDLAKTHTDITLRLKLQSYERLALFLERIHPRTLMNRSYETGMNVRTFQTVLINNIQTEFEHNLSQQIYVSVPLWNAVKSAKEQMLNIVNQFASRLPADGDAKLLHKAILEFMLTTDQLPTEGVILLLNEEAKQVLR